MRKTFLIITIFFISVFVTAETMFNSNVLGMQFDELDFTNNAVSDFVLVVYDDEYETKELFKGNKLYSKTTTIYEYDKTITTIEKDDEREIISLRDGLIISEEREKVNAKKELIKYEYRDRIINKVEHYLEDNLQYTDVYYYTKEGRLLEIKRSYDDEQTAIFSTCYKDGKIASYLLSLPSGTSYLEFDKNGVLFSDFSDTQSGEEKREYVKLKNGNYQLTITNKTTGNVIVNIFDRSNKILESIERTSEGNFIEEKIWKYRNNLVKSLKIRHKDFSELYEYRYRGADKLANMKYFRNGVIMQETSYIDENNYTKILFRYEKPVISVKYEDGIKTSTMDIQE